MNKILWIVGVLTLFIPLKSYAAESITFTPASPQSVSGGDISLDESNSGLRWIPFKPDGTSGGCASDTVGTPEDYATKFPIASGCSGQTMPVFSGIGTMHLLRITLTGSWIADCISGNYTTCLASGAYQGDDMSYEFTAAPEPPAYQNATSTLDQAQQNLGIATIIFLYSMTIMISLIKRK